MKDRMQCLWFEPAGKLRRFFRRFTWSGQSKCSSQFGSHNASVFLDEMEDLTPYETISCDIDVEPFKDDSRWPTHCVCGYAFQPDDQYQISVDRIYRRTDTGEEMTFQTAPAGAMWDAWWYPDAWKGSDGIALVVKMPQGGEWVVDSRCSNCTLPNDNVHKCWIRHGNPRKPETLLVDKNGVTCKAGGGSIQMTNWHGFLRFGFLEEC